MSCQGDEEDVLSRHVLTGTAIDAEDVSSPLLSFPCPLREGASDAKKISDIQAGEEFLNVDDEELLPGSYTLVRSNGSCVTRSVSSSTNTGKLDCLTR
jgi:hypothetical protein